MKHLSLTNLSDLLKQRRNEKNITQEQLCEITGINRNMIGRIERMTYIPSIPQLEKLAEVLSFNVEELFVDDSSPGVYTAFRGNQMTSEERKGAEHLMNMMVAAKQQIMLRKAFHHEA
ncbi:MAG: helix-turn-helix transcriptional regulator [Lachnospiraceae bacterium]|nr:helix-turn-helix transcriptional regulator [Lachnospiraceae bacterium]